MSRPWYKDLLGIKISGIKISFVNPLSILILQIAFIDLYTTMSQTTLAS